MFEFIGSFRLAGAINCDYVKIMANSFDEANDKLEEYLENKNYKWVETDVIQILDTID